MTTELAKLFEENEAWLDRGYYEHPTAGRVPLADAGDATRCYQLDELTGLLTLTGDTRPMSIEVTGESSLQAARRLYDQRGGTVGVLNFASARHPGGGYRTGARAQEEDLCRQSALYRSLLRAPEYYSAHKTDPTYSHRVICSPGVPVFRDHHYVPLAKPFPVTFLTCAAPNAGVVAERDPARLAQIPGIFAERIARVLAVAAHHDVDSLVLGAWGCGVFRNVPADVANAFNDQLAGPFAGRFARVTFAVHDRTPHQKTLGAFQEVF